MTRVPFFLLIAAVLVVGPAPGQFTCFGDDGFNVPGACCIPVTPALPPFPPMTLPAEGCCFRDCGIDFIYPFQIFLAPPVPLFCDVYIIQITFIGGPSIQTGFLVGKYARTWLESDPTGIIGRQVWRFLVNTDLIYLPPFSPPCPTPTCAAGGGLPVHFVGSVDYAEDCIGSGSWNVALNLTHFCGDLAHGPLSNRPTTFDHRDRVFSMVAPTPFDWTATGMPPTGAAFGESVRSTQANLGTLTWNCYSEVPVSGGTTLGAGMTCPCTASLLSPARWYELDIRFNYGCTFPGGFNFGPIVWPPLVPSGFSLFPLGTYTGPPSSYPSFESVSSGFGLAFSPDPCNFNFPFHFIYGVATEGGDFAQLFGLPVGSNVFLDLQNCLTFSSAPPFLNLGYGSIFLSTMVWSLNY